MTTEELVNVLLECVSKGFYFEIDEHDAKTLLDYIRELESAANDPRDAP